MIIKRTDLLNIIKEKCQGMKYSIGLHGANSSFGFPSVSNEEVLKRIEEDGLISHRKLTGTIEFFGRGDKLSNDSENKMKFDNYNYSNMGLYAILVFPSCIKTSDGNEIYLGSPNLNSKYSRYFEATGRELTSLADIYYQTQWRSFTDGKGIIDRRFVFGTFKVLDDQNIDLHLNPHFIKSNELDIKLHLVFPPVGWKILEQTKIDKLLHLDLTKEETQELEMVENKLLHELYSTKNKCLIQEVCVPILETIDQLKSEVKLEEIEKMKEIQYVTDRLQLLRDDYYKVFDEVMNDVKFFKYGLRQLNNINDEQLCKEFRIHFLCSSNPIIFEDPELVELALKNGINIVDRIPAEMLDGNDLIREITASEEFDDGTNKKVL